MPHMTDERVRAGLAREEDLSLLNEVSMKTAGVSHLEMCIQCGTCGGSCPAAMDMDHTPRMLFAMLRAGMRDEVLRSNTPWICVSCYHCVVRCPQEEMLRRIGPTLVCSAITEDTGFQHELVNAQQIDRLNIGAIPTIRLDWLQPHEGNIVEFLFRPRAFQSLVDAVAV